MTSFMITHISGISEVVVTKMKIANNQPENSHD